MAKGKFDSKQITFNPEQIELIRNYSIDQLHEMTGMCKSNCFFLRSNRPQDYRLSTITSLAKGMGLKPGDFLELGGGPVIMDFERN